MVYWVNVSESSGAGSSSSQVKDFCRAIAGMQCLFVRLSVTFVSCAKTNKDIFEICSPSGSHTILVFSIPNGVAIFRRKQP